MVQIIPLIAVSFGGVMIARKVGLKRTFLIGTWGSMIMLAAMFLVRPNPSAPWIFLAFYLVQKCIASVGNASIIPMIADCTDYENLRSGRFIPSMMGTLFSFVDKMISSFSSLIQGIALAAARRWQRHHNAQPAGWREFQHINFDLFLYRTHYRSYCDSHRHALL